MAETVLLIGWRMAIPLNSFALGSVKDHLQAMRSLVALSVSPRRIGGSTGSPSALYPRQVRMISDPGHKTRS